MDDEDVVVYGRDGSVGEWAAVLRVDEDVARPVNARTHMGRVHVVDGVDASEEGVTSRELKRTHFHVAQVQFVCLFVFCLHVCVLLHNTR